MWTNNAVECHSRLRRVGLCCLDTPGREDGTVTGLWGPNLVPGPARGSGSNLLPECWWAGEEPRALTGNPGKPSVPFPGGPSSPWGWDGPSLGAQTGMTGEHRPPTGGTGQEQLPESGPGLTHPLTHQPRVSRGSSGSWGTFGTLRREGCEQEVRGWPVSNRFLLGLWKWGQPEPGGPRGSKGVSGPAELPPELPPERLLEGGTHLSPRGPLVSSVPFGSNGTRLTLQKQTQAQGKKKCALGRHSLP